MEDLNKIALISQDLSNLSCKNLIDAFNQSTGGKFTCMYDKHICELKTNDISITTNIKKTDPQHIEQICWVHQQGAYITYIKNGNNQYKYIRKIHNYQGDDETGFTVQFKLNKDNSWDVV